MATKISRDNYVRPKETVQDRLTDNDIQELLAGYTLVDDIRKVPTGSHLRYFSIGKNGKKTFRYGGLLKNKDEVDKYIILSNGKVSWSVQTSNTEFYRKMSFQEMKEDYEAIIAEKDAKIKKLKDKLAKYVQLAAALEKTQRDSEGKRNR